MCANGFCITEQPIMDISQLLSLHLSGMDPYLNQPGQKELIEERNILSQITSNKLRILSEINVHEQALHILSSSIYLNDGSLWFPHPIAQMATQNNNVQLSTGGSLSPWRMEINHGEKINNNQIFWDFYAEAIKRELDLKHLHNASVQVVDGYIQLRIGRTTKNVAIATIDERCFFGGCKPSKFGEMLPPFLLKDIKVTTSSTSRPLFFLNTDVEIDIIRKQLCMHESSQIISFTDFIKKPCEFDTTQQLIIVSPFLDSVDLYGHLRSKLTAERLKVLVGGVWSCHHIPQICHHCSVTAQKIPNCSEHSMSFNEDVKVAGSGCVHCDYGYVGVINLLEMAGADAIDSVLISFIEYEQENPPGGSSSLMGINSKYADKQSHASIYSAIQNTVNQQRASVDDAVKYRL